MNQVYRECELKYKINNPKERLFFINKLIINNFKFLNNVIETDFYIDTNERILKKNKALFRIRVSINQSKLQYEIFITVKTKGTSSEFQDNEEIEFLSIDNNNENCARIIERLMLLSGIQVYNSDLSGVSIKNILLNLNNRGFLVQEVLQKKRQYYYNNSISKVSFDEFPNHIGTYLEIEAQQYAQLMKTISILGLSLNQMEKRNYGQLIFEKGIQYCLFEEDDVSFDVNSIIDLISSKKSTK